MRKTSKRHAHFMLLVSKPITPCRDEYFLWFTAKTCHLFYDIQLDSNTFTGCSRISFSDLDLPLALLELGCFDIRPTFPQTFTTPPYVTATEELYGTPPMN